MEKRGSIADWRLSRQGFGAPGGQGSLDTSPRPALNWRKTGYLPSFNARDFFIAPTVVWPSANAASPNRPPTQQLRKQDTAPAAAKRGEALPVMHFPIPQPTPAPDITDETLAR